MEFGLVSLLIFELLFILFGIYLIFSWLTKTPYYPSSSKALKKLFKELNLDKDLKFVDIGSGDGKVVIMASKQGLNAHGIEYNPFLTLLSRFKILLNRQSKNSKIFNMDFRNHNFANYDVAYLYIYGIHMQAVAPKLFAEMKKGSIIITNTFKIVDEEPDKIIDKFYIYYIK